MTIPVLTFSQCKALERKGASYIVFATYYHAGYGPSDFISWHKSHEAAARAVGRSQFRAVYDLMDVETELGISYWNTKRKLGE